MHSDGSRRYAIKGLTMLGTTYTRFTCTMCKSPIMLDIDDEVHKCDVCGQQYVGEIKVYRYAYSR